MLPTTPTRTDSRVNNRVADSGMTRGRVLALLCVFFFLMFRLEFGPFFRVPCCAARAGYVLRSHHSDYTASHPNCEVKHCWAQSVLRWGTTRESRVSNVFFFICTKFFFRDQNFFSGTNFFLLNKIFFVFCPAYITKT